MSTIYMPPQMLHEHHYYEEGLTCVGYSQKRQRTDEFPSDVVPTYHPALALQFTPPKDHESDWSSEVSGQASISMDELAMLHTYPDPMAIPGSQDAYPSPQSSCSSAPDYLQGLEYAQLQDPNWLSGSLTCDFELPTVVNDIPIDYVEPMLYDESLMYMSTDLVDVVHHPFVEQSVSQDLDRARKRRATSFTSSSSYHQTYSPSEASRSASPNASEMSRWGIRNEDGTWSCAYPGCSSRSTFHRGCDLRKHYKRHTKSLFCRHHGCPQATEGGFSSKKDRARHEAKHNPSITCEWEGCGRMFSRVDNMKDHVRRVHRGKTQCDEAA